MRKIFFIVLTFAAPLIAVAQNYDSPLIVTGEQSTKPAATIAPPPETNDTAPTPPTTAPATKPLPTSTTEAGAPPMPPNFPEWAVSQAGQHTSGNIESAPPARPASPDTPARAKTPATPPAAERPASPPSPESPVSKLWPRDTVPIFVKSCIGFHVELIPACTCVITQLMATMPHDEFLELSQNDKIESDARLTQARQNCVATPARKE